MLKSSEKSDTKQERKQAGTELGQAQLKVGLNFILIFVDLVSLEIVL